MSGYTQKFKKIDIAKKQPDAAPIVWLVEGKNVGGTNNGVAVAEVLNPDYRIILPNGITKNSDGTLEVEFKGNLKAEKVYAKDFPDVLIDVTSYGYTVKEWNAQMGVKDFAFKSTLPVHLPSPNRVYGVFDTMGDLEGDGLQIVYKHQIADNAEVPPNVRVVATVPTRVNAKTLEEGREKWGKQLFPEGIKPPVYCVLSSRGENTNEEEEMARKVRESLRKTGGSLLFTTAPNTINNKHIISIYRKAVEGLNVPTYFYNYNPASKEKNPYLGMLAVADKIIIPTDSISMTSDALATGKSVYQNRCDYGYGNNDSDIKYNSSLQQSGAILPLSRLSEQSPKTTAINSAAEIAQAIRDELKARSEQHGSKISRQQEIKR